jgi:hypothetical protein
MKKVSSHELRAAADKLLYAKSEYCRQFKHLTPEQVEVAESTIEAAHDMMVLAGQKLQEVVCAKSANTSASSGR